MLTVPLTRVRSVSVSCANAPTANNRVCPPPLSTVPSTPVIEATAPLAMAISLSNSITPAGSVTASPRPTVAASWAYVVMSAVVGTADMLGAGVGTGVGIDVGAASATQKSHETSQ